MKLCQRCSLHPATTTVSGLPMCGVCTAQLDWRYGAPKSQVSGTSPVKTGALSDVDAWGVAIPPLGAYEALKGHGGSSGEDDSISGSAHSAASAVKETASSIKTVAVVIGVVTGVSVLYLIWQAAKNARAVQHDTMQMFASNPNMQHAATHAILL